MAWARFVRSGFVAVAAATVLASPGCTGSDRPEVVPVSGRVTYRGEPVVGATVSFLAEGASRPATGMTGDDGSFRLTTFEPDDGAIPGTHRVTVTKPSTEAEAAVTVADLESEEYRRAMADAAKNPPKRDNGGLPPKYADLRATDLAIEVKSGAANEFPIELRD